MSGPSYSVQDLAKLLAASMAAGRDGAHAAVAIEQEVYARAPDTVQHYVLRGREAAEASAEEYVAWRQSVGWPCRIAVTEVGVSLVSTELVGVNLRPDEPGPPVLYQTVTCSDEQDFDGLSWEARTYAEALGRHASVVRALEGGHDEMAALLDEHAA